MRQILFRGKRIDNGEWVVGFLLKECNYATCSWNLAIEYKTDRFGKFAYDVAEVGPDTVGQFTGLTNKNGVKIFEGDIVSIRFEGDAEPPSTPPVWYENAEVFFSDEFLAWDCRFTDGLEMHLAEYNDCDVFVIGNIHDNPELLEGEG